MQLLYDATHKSNPTNGDYMEALEALEPEAEAEAEAEPACISAPPRIPFLKSLKVPFLAT